MKFMTNRNTKFHAVVLAIVLASLAPVAMAQQTLGAAALAQISTLSTDVNAILIALIVVVFAILAFMYFRKAAK